MCRSVCFTVPRLWYPGARWCVHANLAGRERPIWMPRPVGLDKLNNRVHPSTLNDGKFLGQCWPFILSIYHDNVRAVLSHIRNAGCKRDIASNYRLALRMQLSVYDLSCWLRNELMAAHLKIIHSNWFWSSMYVITCIERSHKGAYWWEVNNGSGNGLTQSLCLKWVQYISYIVDIKLIDSLVLSVLWLSAGMALDKLNMNNFSTLNGKIEIHDSQCNLRCKAINIFKIFCIINPLGPNNILKMASSQYSENDIGVMVSSTMGNSTVCPTDYLN